MNTAILKMVAEKIGQSQLASLRAKFKTADEYNAAIVSAAVIFAKESIGLSIEEATDLIMGKGAYDEIYKKFLDARQA